MRTKKELHPSGTPNECVFDFTHSRVTFSRTTISRSAWHWTVYVRARYIDPKFARTATFKLDPELFDPSLSLARALVRIMLENTDQTEFEL